MLGIIPLFWDRKSNLNFLKSLKILFTWWKTLKLRLVSAEAWHSGSNCLHRICFFLFSCSAFCGVSFILRNHAGSPSCTPMVQISHLHTTQPETNGEPISGNYFLNSKLISWLKEIKYWFCYCSVTQSCLTLRAHRLQHAKFTVLHYLPELAQTHIHWVGDSIHPSHPLLPPSLPVLSLSQHHDLFQRVLIGLG